ncbi:unnamed protein product [Rangifer tarandus platyrhynchus]|uniref:Uncharacterized protein n=2 Tax=Rangifer tarandus platyrhynchus TaxID=3082113 RepID=A0AC59Z587_RANTA|nr:unnamed protein product [Rangifer tarandus platyrhynchus]
MNSMPGEMLTFSINPSASDTRSHLAHLPVPTGNGWTSWSREEESRKLMPALDSRKVQRAGSGHGVLLGVGGFLPKYIPSPTQHIQLKPRVLLQTQHLLSCSLGP